MKGTRIIGSIGNLTGLRVVHLFRSPKVQPFRYHRSEGSDDLALSSTPGHPSRQIGRMNKEMRCDHESCLSISLRSLLFSHLSITPVSMHCRFFHVVSLESKR